LRYFFFLVSDLSSDLHQSCLDYVQDSEHKLIYQALACGQRLYNYQHVHALKQMGIIHVFVVSGMHLSFLSKLIHHLFPPPILEVAASGGSHLTGAMLPTANTGSPRLVGGIT
jgi:hypothetical protein